MTKATTYAVSSIGLSKSYEGKPALADVSFDIGEGELFGFIGPDGAGKTTLFRILTTLLLADSGVATVLGRDVVSDFRALRKHIGYMPGRFSLYTDLTVRENLNFFASIFGTTVDENYELIRDIYEHIQPFEDRRAGALSGGMKQKLALSCALIHRPDILFLDEPTTGVDAVSRREFWDMLFKLKSSGLTIIVSTPYMDEATRCDRIALIQDGKILKIDCPDKLVQDFEFPLFAVYGKNKFALLTALRSFEPARSVFPFGESVHVAINEKRFNGEGVDTKKERNSSQDQAEFSAENDTINEWNLSQDVAEFGAGIDTEHVLNLSQHAAEYGAQIRHFLKEKGIEARVEVIMPTVEDVFLDLSIDGADVGDERGDAPMGEDVVDEQRDAPMGADVVDERGDAPMGEDVVDEQRDAPMGEDVVDEQRDAPMGAINKQNDHGSI